MAWGVRGHGGYEGMGRHGMAAIIASSTAPSCPPHVSHHAYRLEHCPTEHKNLFLDWHAREPFTDPILPMFRMHSSPAAPGPYQVHPLLGRALPGHNTPPMGLAPARCNMSHFTRAKPSKVVPCQLIQKCTIEKWWLSRRSLEPREATSSIHNEGAIVATGTPCIS